MPATVNVGSDIQDRSAFAPEEYPAKSKIPTVTDPRWSSGINKVRRFHDIACATLAAGAIGIGVVLQRYPEHYPERLAGNPFILYLLIGSAVASVVALLVIPRWSYRPLENAPLSSKEIP